MEIVAHCTGASLVSIGRAIGIGSASTDAPGKLQSLSVTSRALINPVKTRGTAIG
jgi:hypothetical protein